MNRYLIKDAEFDVRFLSLLEISLGGEIEVVDTIESVGDQDNKVLVLLASRLPYLVNNASILTTIRSRIRTELLVVGNDTSSAFILVGKKHNIIRYLNHEELHLHHIPYPMIRVTIDSRFEVLQSLSSISRDEEFELAKIKSIDVSNFTLDEDEVLPLVSSVVNMSPRLVQEVLEATSCVVSAILVHRRNMEEDYEEDTIVEVPSLGVAYLDDDNIKMYNLNQKYYKGDALQFLEKEGHRAVELLLSRMHNKVVSSIERSTK